MAATHLEQAVFMTPGVFDGDAAEALLENFGQIVWDEMPAAIGTHHGGNHDCFMSAIAWGQAMFCGDGIVIPGTIGYMCWGNEQQLELYMIPERQWDPVLHLDVRDPLVILSIIRPWDPGIFHAVAWGQAMFCGGGNVTSIDMVYTQRGPHPKERGHRTENTELGFPLSLFVRGDESSHVPAILVGGHGNLPVRASSSSSRPGPHHRWPQGVTKGRVQLPVAPAPRSSKKLAPPPPRWPRALVFYGGGGATTEEPASQPPARIGTPAQIGKISMRSLCIPNPILPSFNLGLARLELTTGNLSKGDANDKQLSMGKKFLEKNK
ncbi:unnamed protein product [Miscanthus lutarioriparius]|uniref:Uncharacterized protein n=1 Tax=Miscanthus lutarioriparius TaxID=422564 RepID=A0A811MHX7_9POAL|nr:unnamed protein product [Miscanthus lutarioriparius]